ncbi:hypothetical protein Xcel_0456 [Xylanimonas cellulosilytica DSM 15894]|uniref:Uncharacterized protein n=1 Tax=Xylanimonas cellulosilytica (strain DSM 15894 / JCM 12276 / CECT 5975 / KCTC 9989 / LMG 20990 / NBRC 107835 / XIL07) TaxID=446471 RepID=D1BVZ2_XYLCX|nr:hypothetical protein [Xylanimonas cellulosilytica]ACZ29495.1 hypothetical protein Xcel_0456 [Xylanimonas cellulosilytica DSM 15894]
MSNLLTREVLDSAVIDRDVSQDLYTYDADVRGRDADGNTPRVIGTLDFHPWLHEFTD